MSRRRLATTCTRAIVGAALCSLLPTVTDLVPQAATQRTGWTVPRTPHGHPDLQGYWTNDTFTPLERPPELAGKEFFTAEEAAAYLQLRLDQFLGQPTDVIHYDDAIWQGENYDKQPNPRTSLIFDPPDGRIPPLTPEAERRAPAARTTDSVESRSLAERCIAWGNVGPPMVPPSYNANLQILQTRDHVVIRHEMIHENRIIPLDERPHVEGNPRLLAGDSRGYWEGDTLVAKTTNFTDKTNFRGAPRNTRQDIFVSDTLRVVERFTLVDSDTIHYQFTVKDPSTWIGPWSGEVPIRRFGGPLFEYACHEGNYGLPNILRGARVNEADETSSR